MMLITLIAVVVAAAVPWQVLASEIETLPAVIVPLGKPDPVTLMLFTPATPLSGVVATFSLTAAIADPAEFIDPITMSSQNKKARSRKLPLAERSEPLNFIVSTPGDAQEFGDCAIEAVYI
jgi:hypothetical protein